MSLWKNNKMGKYLKIIKKKVRSLKSKKECKRGCWKDHRGALQTNSCQQIWKFK